MVSLWSRLRSRSSGDQRNSLARSKSISWRRIGDGRNRRVAAGSRDQRSVADWPVQERSDCGKKSVAADVTVKGPLHLELFTTSWTDQLNRAGSSQVLVSDKL